MVIHQVLGQVMWFNTGNYNGLENVSTLLAYTLNSCFIPLEGNRNLRIAIGLEETVVLGVQGRACSETCEIPVVSESHPLHTCYQTCN